MFKNDVYKRIFAAMLTVSLLAGPAGVFATNGQNQTQKPGRVKRLFNWTLETTIKKPIKWLFQGDTKSLVEIGEELDKTSKRVKEYEKNVITTTLDPNKPQHKLALQRMDELKKRRREKGSFIYKLLNPYSFKEIISPTIYEPKKTESETGTAGEANWKKRTAISLKNGARAITSLLIGGFLGKFVQPMVKPSIDIETKKITESNLSTITSLCKWFAYGLCAVYTIRAKNALSVKLKKDIGLAHITQLPTDPLKKAVINENGVTYKKIQNNQQQHN